MFFRVLITHYKYPYKPTSIIDPWGYGFIICPDFEADVYFQRLALQGALSGKRLQSLGRIHTLSQIFFFRSQRASKLDVQLKNGVFQNYEPTYCADTIFSDIRRQYQNFEVSS